MNKQLDAENAKYYFEARPIGARAGPVLPVVLDHYLPGAQFWQVEPGFHAFVTRDRQAEVIESDAVIFATGHRNVPPRFPAGLPGVLTVGAAQILLKNAAQIPVGPVWIAGSGPLPLLYAVQLIRAGGQVDGYLDTTPPGEWRAALRHLPRALRRSGELIKGLGWTAALRKSNARHIKAITKVEALGRGRIEAIRYRSHNGAMATFEARMLLVHECVVPFVPTDQTIVCRCEEATAGEIRALAEIGQPGPNQIKAATRTGMGPCQGSQCGYTVTRILSAAQNRPPSDVGYFHVRPPLKPVTIGELASIDPSVASGRAISADSSKFSRPPDHQTHLDN
jgi:hypothetical protein